MELKVEPGTYVLAVSGGVDSMVLLDLLAKQAIDERLQVAGNHVKSNLQPLASNLNLVVAHFNHGIRGDSQEDERLAARAAAEYGLPFEAGHDNLGAAASEESARRARYKFLEKVQKKYGAKAIITAHHQDDLIETAIINLLRGTGRRGLIAMSSNQNVLRPLLGYPKVRILKYARHNGLEWREDTTNQNQDYLRNYVRQQVISKLSPAKRRRFLEQIGKVQTAAPRIDSWLKELSKAVRSDGDIDRGRFIALPAELGSELLMYWLRQAGLRDFDKKTINRLNVAIRTSKPGSRHPVKDDMKIEVGIKSIRFERERQTAC